MQRHIEGFRLSPQQHRFWTTLPDPSHGVPTVTAVLDLQGPLHQPALEAALARVVSDHEILRTQFVTPYGVTLPIQVIEPHGTPERINIDWTSLDKATKRTYLDALLIEERARLINPSAPSPLRATLASLSENEHALLLAASVLHLDTASFQLLADALQNAYGEEVDGVRSEGEKLQYADVSEWLHEVREGEAGETARRFWHRHTETHGGRRRPLALERDGTGEETELAAARVFTVAVPDVMVRRTRARSSAFNVPLSTVFQTAWYILLARAGDGEYGVAELACPGRVYEELTGVLGPLETLVPIALAMNETDTFTSLVLALEETLRGVREWEAQVNLPEPTHTPFHAPFVFRWRATRPTASAAGLLFRMRAPPGPALRGGVALDVVDDGERIELLWTHDTNRLSAAAVAALTEQYLTLLDDAVAAPERRAIALNALGENGRRLVIHEFNPEAEAIEEDALHRVFERQARRTPDAAAVEFGPDRLTYRELDERANRLARHLRALGVRDEAFVVLDFERSLDMIVAVLATLKAGGAYVPVDPAWPAERLAFILEETRAPVLLTQASLRDRQPETSAAVVCLDQDRDAFETQASAPLNLPVAPNRAAYAIYTSGSTGRPKAVVVEHRSPLHLLHGLERVVYRHRCERPLRVTLNAPLAFDASVQQIVMLLRGHTLVIIPQEARTDGTALVRYLREHPVDAMDATPSQLRIALAGGLFEDPVIAPALVLLAGEAVDPALWRRLIEAPHSECFNIYGPTEATVDATAYCVRDGAARPTIGRPLPNYVIRLLDSEGVPVPIGIAGEIYIGGAAVARGYLNRPELTHERFLPDHIGNEPGGRLYRTGDLSRWREDGTLEFVGRVDQQVKLRGYRIEPGEIECALAEHPGVGRAVVVVNEDDPGEQRLVAYVVPETANGALDLKEAILRDWAAQRLPTYMVPAAFLILDALPMTTSGKVDVRALPAPDRARNGDRPYMAPRDAVENDLCAIWSKVLGRKRVGINDNYFALGGDSIRSIRVQVLASEQGLRFALQDLFRHQTVRELAAIVETDRDVRPESRTRPFDLCPPGVRARLPDDVEDAFPLSSMQAGMVFHTEVSTDSAAYQNVIGFRLRAHFDQNALQGALVRLVERHAVLRTSFQLSEFDEPMQLVHCHAEAPLEVFDLRDLPEEERERRVAAHAEAEKCRRFDWACPPFVRLAAHRLSDSTFYMTFTEHQSVLDGWSLASLLTELFGTYLALSEARSVPYEPAPQASLRESVALEREAAASSETVAFWQRVLDGAEPVSLPSWQDLNPTVTRTRSAQLDVFLRAEVLESLRTLGARSGLPLKSLLLAVHLRVMGALGARSDVLTGMVVNDRPETADGDRVLGPFLNTVPIRLTLREGESWEALARRAFDAEVEITRHRRYPVGAIRKMYGGNPFEAVFNFTHFHVYESLNDVGDVEVLEKSFFERSDLPLIVDLSVTPVNPRLRIGLICNGHSDAQLRSLASYYETALEAMASEPGEPYAARLVQPSEELDRVLRVWNETLDDPVPLSATYPSLFRQQVLLTPDAVAVEHRGRALTFRRLEHRTRQLADALRRRRAAPETVVAIFAERSLDLVAVMIATFRTGAAFLLLDPRNPAARQAQILDCASPLLLLTDDAHADDAERALALLPKDRRPILDRVRLDLPHIDDYEDIEDSAESDALAEPAPENLAYLVFTSGSTGVPKGVLTEHGGMLNHMRAKIRDLDLGASDALAQTSSVSFAIVVWQCLAPLLVGARVVILDDEVANDPHALWTAVHEDGISVVQLVPAMLQALLDDIKARDDASEEHSCCRLRWMVSTGDALSRELALCWLRRFPDVPLLNTYGSTESSDDHCHLVLRSEEDVHPDRPVVSIGSPIPGMRALVLDKQMRPVPIGVTGELFTSGVGVGRGYIGDGAKTAAAFVPAEVGRRAYRTGDRARWGADGRLEFIGRADGVLKLRGLRIEPGEVEGRLRELAGVKEAVVIAREDPHSGKRLVAYVTVKIEGSEEDRQHYYAEFIAALWDHARRTLPKGMVPSAFVVLEHLPLNANGKIDRRALPAPTATEGARTLMEPRTPTEARIASLWSELLQVPHVGVTDDFMELGGDSIIALRVAARARRDGLAIEPRMMFETPTVAALAARIDASTGVASTAAAPEEQRVPFADAGLERNELEELLARVGHKPARSEE